MNNGKNSKISRISVLQSCILGLSVMLCAHNTYADECEKIVCTFDVNSFWHEEFTGHECPNSLEHCDTEIWWKICSGHITSQIGVVDEKNVTMKDGLVEEMKFIKHVDKFTIVHIIEKKQEKITLSSKYIHDPKQQVIATIDQQDGKFCSVTYEEDTASSINIAKPVTAHHKTGTKENKTQG